MLHGACTVRRYLAKGQIPSAACVIKSFSRSRGSKGKERRTACGHRMTRDEGGTGGRGGRQEKKRGGEEKGTTDFGSAAPALCASSRIKDEGGRRGRARKEKVNGEGGRERALGEEGTTDIHHKAGCSGADGRGSSGSECRKLPECTAAAAAAFSRCLSAVRALLPSSRRGLCGALLRGISSEIAASRRARYPARYSGCSGAERTSRPTLSIDVRIRHR